MIRDFQKRIEPIRSGRRTRAHHWYGNSQRTEWNTLADLLDDRSPDLSTSVQEIWRTGDVITVTIAIEPTSDRSENEFLGFPPNPLAASLSDLVTAKQLGMIRAIGRDMGIDADEECTTLVNCKTGELSKNAASYFIQHLDKRRIQTDGAASPLRRVS